MNFLFWNINRKDLSDSIVLLCEKHDIDVLILAENQIPDAQLILKLNAKSSDYHFQNPIAQSGKVKIFTKFHYDFIIPVADAERFSVRKVCLPLREEFLVTAIHFIDKSNHTNESQSIEASIIAAEIEKIETEQNIFKNIVVGDFNMNPFEKGMIKTNGFHATMSEDVALNNGRTVQGKYYRYFYNPMWALYGDLLSKPAGTYFYPSSEHISYQWNVFDQVLLRPEIIPKFEKQSLKIITTDGLNSLTQSNNRPNKDLYSDHLPIKFTINI